MGNSFYNLGLKSIQEGNHRRAIELLEKALAISPQPMAYYYLGLAYGHEGNQDKAEGCYKKAVKMDSNLSKAYNNLGIIYLGKNDLQRATVYFKKAITGDPSNFPVYNNLANAYKLMGKLKEATKYYLKATDGNPNLPEPHNNLGRVYFEQGEFEKATNCFSKAIKIDPQYASAYSNLGNAQMRMGALDKAEVSLKHYLKLNPGDKEGHFLLMATYNEFGNRYKTNHNPASAIKYYQKAIKQGPKTAITYCNLGLTLSRLDNLNLAVKYLKKAIEIDPKYAEAYYSLGSLNLKLERWNLAKEDFQNTLKINPQFGPALSLLSFVLMQQCDWPKYTKAKEKLDRIILKEIKNGLRTSETPLLNILKDENPKINFEVARSWSKSAEENVLPKCSNFYFNKKNKRKQLTIGYLSGDFYDHATAHLTLRMFKLHDKNKFKIYGYSYGPDDGSFYRKEIKKSCDEFVDLSNLGNIEAAKKIFKDDVDILVDLKGYTEGGRLEICALHPAPIQTTYLGFPGSTGSNFIDYLITDKIIIPPKDTKYYSEKLVFLPYSYQVNNDQQKISEKKFTRADFRLPERAFVFCSFNQPNKIEPRGFSAWMKILKTVPNSVLWLLENNPFMEVNLKKEADKSGVSPQRLVFSPSLPKDEHLKRLALSDLALDTFRYNGHTTTSDCLWVGVPVVTLKGKHFASRVSASLLAAIGLPELITHTPKEYEDLAISLANNPAALIKIKQKLAKNRLTKPLFDTQKFVANLEKAYQKMWQRFIENKRPDHIYI